MSKDLHLAIQGLSVHYGQAVALDGVSIEIPRGSLVSVVGSNGAGKTTLIRTIAGMIRPKSGSIRFGGREIGGLSSDRICEAGIGQVAEGRQIFPSLTVLENLDLGGALKRSRKNLKRNRERVLDLYPRLAERKSQSAGTMSGGEQQMLAIGRCLMAEPELIMFDEPSLGLAPLLVEQMFDNVRALNAEGITVLLVEQNVMESLGISNYGYVLESGQNALQGPASELLTDDDVKKAYLGL